MYVTYLCLITFCIFCFCSQPKQELKIMTFNIRYGTAEDGENSWENRKSILIETLKKYQPNILGTQESLDFQIEEIHSAFPDWKVFGMGRYHGIELPERPHESMSGESCRIFYDSTKLILVKEGTFWHSNTPEVAGSMTWGNTLPRITTWGMFQIKKNKRKFVVINTHYHWDEPYVTNASNLIMHKWREIAGDLPVILMGDFNLPPTSETHQLFCKKSENNNYRKGFLDPWIELGKSEQDSGTYNDFIGDKSGDRIDWILVTPQFEMRDIQVIYDNIDKKFPSDHFPVLTILRL